MLINRRRNLGKLNRTDVNVPRDRWTEERAWEQDYIKQQNKERMRVNKHLIEKGYFYRKQLKWFRDEKCCSSGAKFFLLLVTIPL